MIGPFIPSGHCVYRAYDTDGVLLYVGQTANPYRRLSQHRRCTPWWETVVELRVVLFPSYIAAAAEERRSILEDGPLFNRSSTPEPKREGWRTRRALGSHPFAGPEQVA